VKYIRFNGTHTAPAPAARVVHWAAASSGAAIGAGVAVVAGSLWSAAAFSSRDSAYYNHLAWWLGATFIFVAFVGALVAAILASPRGLVPGLANGLSAWGVLVVGAAVLVLGAAAASATTVGLTVDGSRVGVELVRPYVLFWSALGSLGAAGLGGLAGGLFPRQQPSVIEAVVDLSGAGRPSEPADGSRRRGALAS
jgi:hypothetical protein